LFVFVVEVVEAKEPAVGDANAVTLIFFGLVGGEAK
jgi:hypothetical protein